MKKLFLAFVVLLMNNSFSNAQGMEFGLRLNQMINLPAEYKVPESDLEIKGKINYFSGDLFAQFTRANNSFFRFRLGMNSLKLSNDIIIDNGDEIRKSNYKASVISFAPGFGEQIVNNKLVFKGGFELPIQLLGKSKFTSEYTYSSGRDIITVKAPAGFAVGLGIFAGFNYSIIKNLAIGSEFGFGFRYLHIKNDVTFLYEEFDNTGALSDTYSEIHSMKVSGITNIPVTASLTIIVKL